MSSCATSSVSCCDVSSILGVNVPTGQCGASRVAQLGDLEHRGRGSINMLGGGGREGGMDGWREGGREGGRVGGWEGGMGGREGWRENNCFPRASFP